MFKTVVTCDICAKEQKHGDRRIEVAISSDSIYALHFDVCPSCFDTRVKPLFVVSGNE